jgi:3-carboxy-cis,cis-muconate cycloisomerase
MVQEHERGIGGWHAEWDTLPEICRLSGGALRQLLPVLEGLEVSPERMRVNLGMLGGLNLAEAVSMALAPHLGRAAAHALVEKCCAQALESGVDLAGVLNEDALVRVHLDADAITRLLDPRRYLGQTHAMIDAVLAAANAAPER